MIAHVAGVPLEEALLVAPGALACGTVVAAWLRARVARARRGG